MNYSLLRYIFESVTADLRICFCRFSGLITAQIPVHYEQSTQTFMIALITLPTIQVCTSKH
jgi:hypothetical protein